MPIYAPDRFIKFDPPIDPADVMLLGPERQLGGVSHSCYDSSPDGRWICTKARDHVASGDPLHFAHGASSASDGAAEWVEGCTATAPSLIVDPANWIVLLLAKKGVPALTSPPALTPDLGGWDLPAAAPYYVEFKPEVKSPALALLQPERQRRPPGTTCCPIKSPTHHWACTKQAGHSGLHCAHGMGDLIAEWMEGTPAGTKPTYVDPGKLPGLTRSLAAPSNPCVMPAPALTNGASITATSAPSAQLKKVRAPDEPAPVLPPLDDRQEVVELDVVAADAPTGFELDRQRAAGLLTIEELDRLDHERILKGRRA